MLTPHYHRVVAKVGTTSLTAGGDTLNAAAMEQLAAQIVQLRAAGVPVVLVTFFLALTGRIPIHRKVARVTFPLWLYVSVTGVVVRVMLVQALGRP